MIAVVDLGIGNVKSILNMLRYLGIEAAAADRAEQIARAVKLILPGVGHFDSGMAALDALGLRDVLNRRVLEDRVPVLGICLGMQLLTKRSDEGTRPGLGWIDAETVAFQPQRMNRRLPLPHMGWRYVSVVRNNPLLSEAGTASRFYHVHGYHLSCVDDRAIVAQTFYGYDFPSVIQVDNIMGVQFHPEKSHRFGMKLLEKFSNDSRAKVLAQEVL